MAIDRAAALRNAEKLLRQGRLDAAIAEYSQIVADQPSDWTTRNTLGDLCVRAGQVERAVTEYTTIADAFRHDGFYSKAGALYRKVLKLKPQDEHAQLQSAEIAAAQNLPRDAREGFTAVLERRRAAGDTAGALAIVVRLGALDAQDVPARLDAARALCQLGDEQGGRLALKRLAEELAERDDSRAIGVFDELARRDPADATLAMAVVDARLRQTPQDVQALSTLVELSIDLGQEARTVDAQSRLCEAHLAAGAVNEARWIAEDLVGRHPDDEVHVERLRRVLQSMGELDIDGLLAAARGVATEPPAAPPAVEAAPLVPAPAPVDGEQPRAADEPHVVLPAPRLNEAVPPPPPTVAQAQHRSPNIEVDLSVVLDQIRKPIEVPGPAATLDDVFAQMRDDARRRLELDAAERDYRRGVLSFQAGQIDDSIGALESASRTPRFRFEAASLLGRIFLNRGDLPRAVEWLERATEAPAPSADDLHRVLYNLADALEGIGENARALAVSMQLQASAGAFLDVAVRIKRLASAQARG